MLFSPKGVTQNVEHSHAWHSIQNSSHFHKFNYLSKLVDLLATHSAGDQAAPTECGAVSVELFFVTFCWEKDIKIKSTYRQKLERI